MHQFLKFHQPFWKIYLRNALVVIVISTLMVIISCLDEEFAPWVRNKIWKVDVQKLASDYSKDDTVYVDRSVSDEMYSKVKILCLILTTPKNLRTKIPMVNATWACRCNKVLYILCTNEQRPDTLSTCHIGESKYHLTGKVRHAFQYSYNHLINQYDWFLKADDDSFFVMENLRYLLSTRPVDTAGYLGYHFDMYLDQGYTSGGAGYVVNRKGLEQLNEKGFRTGACRTDGGDEDVEMGKCFQASGVKLLSSLDKFGRETFHTDKPWQHILGTYPTYLHLYAKNPVLMGADCCSQFVVSYHHVDIQTMAWLHHLIYRTSVYGVRALTNVSQMFPLNV